MWYRKLFRRRPYLKAPTDEIFLSEKAREWLAIHNVTQLNYQDFARLHHDVGLDLATQILYIYLSEYQHTAFVNYINQLSVESFDNQKRVKIIVVPGMYYREYPEVGSNGSIFMEIASRLGFQVELVKTKSLGSICHNIPLIKQVVDSSDEEELWLMSVSRGSLEVRGYLQQCSMALPTNLRGWVNIAGSCYGTPLADSLVANFKQRFITRFLCALLDVDYRSAYELATSNEEWHKNFPFTEQLKMIHIAAIPISSNVSKQLQNRFVKLSQHGPNDGVILLRDYLRLPGLIYPIWGTDHMLRFPHLGSLLYKLYYFIHHQCYKDFNYEDQAYSASFNNSQLDFIQNVRGPIRC